MRNNYTITLKNVQAVLDMLEKANVVFFRGDALHVYDRDDVYYRYEFKDSVLEELAYTKFSTGTTDFRVGKRFFIKPDSTRLLHFSVYPEGQLVINVGMFIGEIIDIRTKEGRALLKKWHHVLEAHKETLEDLLSDARAKMENFEKIVTKVRGE